MGPTDESVIAEGIDIPSGTRKSQEEEESDEGDTKTCELQKFEDLLEMINPWGCWNVTILILGCYCTFMNPLQLISYQFLGATPNYWCHVEALHDANWTTEEIISLAIPVKNKTQSYELEGCLMYDYDYEKAAELGYKAAMDNLPLITKGNPGAVTSCLHRDFNHTQYKSTVVTEWDLVCERRALYSTTQAVSQIGTLIGYLFTGVLLDQYGRRRVVLVSVILSLLSGFGAAFSTSYEMYISLKTIVSCCIVGFYLGCFVTVMELSTPSQRSSVGSMYVIPWALGYMVVPGIAYLIREWRWLQAAYTLPITTLFIYLWILPESPRWLIQKERYEEALSVFLRAAKFNGKSLPPSSSLITAMKQLKTREKSSDDTPATKEGFSKIKNALRDAVALMANSKLRWRTMILFIIWFTASMVYYGISLSSGSLSADPYLYVCLGGAVEIPSYILLWPAIAYLGRRTTLIALYLFCAICISAVAVIIYMELPVPFAANMTLALIGKMSMTAAFHLVFIFTAELYPTRNRSTALSLVNIASRFGSITSPYINDILGEVISFAPAALFASTSILAGGLSLLLPETKGASLVEDDDVGSRGEQKRSPQSSGSYNNKSFDPS
ncbi:solute carrier family 22 member 7-like [Palaemon carinicauda]|uniref:solute carrier family 22 member 7-like n=1 Tax=Palaemon carinicauda TaxID=392227 RepID=UPI0035B59DBB